MEEKMNGFDELYNTLPPIFARRSVGKLTGGIIQPGTCANLDSLGLGVGPEGEGRFRIGKKVVYTREAFLKWLEARVKAPQGKK
jgi:hypothetical protein